MNVLALSCGTIPLLGALVLLDDNFSVATYRGCVVGEGCSGSFFCLFLAVLFNLIFVCFRCLRCFDSFFAVSSDIFNSSFFVLAKYRNIRVVLNAAFLFFTLVELSLSRFARFRRIRFSATTVC